MIKVKIPATSANLGAGFDALGLALGLHNEVIVEESEKTSIVALDGAPVPTGEDNLVYSSMAELARVCGKTLPPVKISQINRIPMARGLGSSSACIIGGLVGANALFGTPLSEQELLDVAVRMEGHPDNVAPALLGGFVCAAMDGKVTHYVRSDVRSDLAFAALIPDFELATSAARRVLPKGVSRNDAVFNLSRAALMSLAIINGRYEQLEIASGDRLHQFYRLPLIPGAEEALGILKNEGAYCATISGAGSTLLAMLPASDTGFVRRARAKLDDAGFAEWELVSLDADNRGTVCFIE